jgi:hypothetical protein
MTSLHKLERHYIEANISEVSALLDRVLPAFCLMMQVTA